MILVTTTKISSFRKPKNGAYTRKAPLPPLSLAICDSSGHARNGLTHKKVRLLSTLVCHEAITTEET